RGRARDLRRRRTRCGAGRTDQRREERHVTGQLPGTGAEARTARCRACSAELAPGTTRCERCGAVQKEVICPHCGGASGASPHAELRYVCDICGAPRVPVLESTVRVSGREIAPLKRAEAARKARSVARALTVGSALLLSLATVVFAGVSIVVGAN